MTTAISPVEDIVADADAEAAEEGRVEGVLDVQIIAVFQGQIGENALAVI